MDPVTNKKWSPEVFDSLVEKKPEVTDFSPKREKTDPSFSVSERLWSVIENDPQIRRDLDKWVNKKVAERLEKENAPFKEEAVKKGYDEGLKQGIEAGKEQFGVWEKKLSPIADEILKEKNQLLRDHEKQWLESLDYLMRRFLVPRRKVAMEDLKQWVGESIQYFEKSGKIVAYLSSFDGETSLMEQFKSDRIELRVDPKLEPGGIRIETDGMGVIFSPEKEWERLEKLLG